MQKNLKKVNRAYEVLSDPMKKRDYDFKKNNNFYGGGNTNIFSDLDQQDSIPDLFKMFLVVCQWELIQKCLVM